MICTGMCSSQLKACAAGTVAAALLVAAAGSPVATRESAAQDPRGGARAWPAVTAQTRPWTRWWWQGSAVEKASLTAQLEALQAAGIGGVEVTPIYGVRGAEERFIPFLSDAWMQMLEHTLGEARRLGLGVDMATGTGWPFGGPWVSDGMSPRSIAYRTWELAAGERLTEPVRFRQTPLVRAVGSQIHVVSEGAPGDPPRASPAQPLVRPDARSIEIGDLVDPVSANRNLQALALEQVKYPRDLPLAALMAYNDSGDAVDLTTRVGADGLLDWTAPPGRWRLYAVFPGWHGKLVERAAPGGEGNVIDHFSRDAIRQYLGRFDKAFAGRPPAGLRAFFNDSYEVDDAAGQADWTLSLLEEFQRRRGYDLRRHLPALFGRSTDDLNARVLADYRETISDLLLDTFTTEWGTWARARKAAIRNQAHGSPGNLLDLYAASDIPETEGAEIQRFKWATSAAHVAGRPLVAAEAATWLGEHFRSTLADVRAAVDRFFLAGVNHIVYHGTAYSPADDPWPGWLFYASVEFTPQNAWWDDFRALNTYVTRVQSFLQGGKPDHDVLVYHPFYESLAVRGPALLKHFGGAAPPAQGTTFERAANELQRAGFTYDFVSDRQIRRLRNAAGRPIAEGGASYQVLVLPSARFIPLETFERILGLARAGITVVSLDDWPADVAGLANLDARRSRFRAAADAVRFGTPDAGGIQEAIVGRGRVLRGGDLTRLLTHAGVRRERMVEQHLEFARRADARGRVYFISNPGERPVDGWVPIGIDAPAAQLFDPMDGRQGSALVRGPVERREVYLQVPAGGTLIVAASPSIARERFESYRVHGPSVQLSGPWTVRFVKGGPTLPQELTIASLTSWTTFGEEAARFSGTATYAATFARPSTTQAKWELDLGQVRESVRVRLNGRDVGTLIAPPFRLVLDDAQLTSTNLLELSVTNLSANRIRDLDRRGVAWKKFYNVNFPARLPENRGPDGLFTAAGWDPLVSGLLGPVRLTPLGVVR
jgi:alpha-L-rhamnosidase